MTMIRTKLTALAVAAVALAACGKEDTTGPAPAAETGAIALLNESTTDLVAVSIPSCEDADWGANRLGGSETIAPGAQRSWSLETGCYDLRVSNGSKTAYWYDIEVTAGNTVEVAVPVAISSSVAATEGAGADLRGR